MQLTCLRPQMTQARAVQLLKSKMREMRHGKLRHDTGFYVPYFLFCVKINNGKATQTLWLAIDAVRGDLDLLRFDQEPATQDFDLVESNQFAACVLSETEALTRLEEKVRREVYRKGFFRVRNLDITGKFFQIFFQPYWAGIYERNNQVTLEIIDAVRGQFEGAKIREIMANWLHQRN